MSFMFNARKQGLLRGALYLSAVVMAGCAAPNSQYYSLQSPAGAPPVAVTQIVDAISVQSVSVPVQVDRPQLVVSRAGDAQVSLLNDSLWAAPLGDEIRQAVAGHLSRQLGVPDLDRISAPGDLPVWTIRLTVHQFDSVYETQARVDTSWRLGAVNAGSRARGLPLVCRATAVVPAGNSVATLVQAHQQALAAVSGLIAVQVQQLREGKPAQQAKAPDWAAPMLTLQGCTTP